MFQHSRVRTLLLTALLLSGVALAGCLDQTPGTSSTPATKTKERFVIALQPTDTPAKVAAAAMELEAYLESRTGVDVEILTPLSYAGVIDALRFKSADAALMGAWPAQLAVAKAEADVVLAEQREVTIGALSTVGPNYYSYYIVRANSSYTSLEDLRGRSIAYTSASSTSGYLFPVARLVELGLIPAPAAGKEADPKAFFGNVVLAGGYQQAWQALESGQVDVAVVAGDIKESLYREILAETRVLETQGPIPSHAVVFAKHLSPGDRETLKGALLELKGERKELMRNLVSGIFVEFKDTTSESHLASLQATLERGGFKYAEKVA